VFGAVDFGGLPTRIIAVTNAARAGAAYGMMNFVYHSIHLANSRADGGPTNEMSQQTAWFPPT